MIVHLLFGSAVASTFAEVPTIEVLTQRSAAVVRGHVAGTHTRPCALGLCTTYTVAVSDTWRGPEREIVRVTLPGGRSGGLTQRVAGLPAWAIGDDVLLFLDDEGLPSWTSVFTVRGPSSATRPATETTHRELSDPLGKRRLTSLQALRDQVIRAESTQP